MQNRTHSRRSPSTSNLSSISGVDSAASVQDQRFRNYPSQAGQNVANQQHSVASTQSRNGKASQGSVTSSRHGLEMQLKRSENNILSFRKQIGSFLQSLVSQQANLVSNAGRSEVGKQLYKVDTRNQDSDK